MITEQPDTQRRERTKPLDFDSLRLPRLVRSQLRRARPSATGRSPALGPTDIEERVRDALYGKTYYGTRKRVFTELFGGRR